MFGYNEEQREEKLKEIKALIFENKKKLEEIKKKIATSLSKESELGQENARKCISWDKTYKEATLPTLASLESNKWIPLLLPEVKPITFQMQENVAPRNVRARTTEEAKYWVTFIIKVETSDTINKIIARFSAPDEPEVSKTCKGENCQLKTEFVYGKFKNLDLLNRMKIEIIVNSQPKGFLCFKKSNVIGSKILDLRALKIKDELIKTLVVQSTKYSIFVYKSIENIEELEQGEFGVEENKEQGILSFGMVELKVLPPFKPSNSKDIKKKGVKEDLKGEDETENSIIPDEPKSNNIHNTKPQAKTDGKDFISKEEVEDIDVERNLVCLLYLLLSIDNLN